MKKRKSLIKILGKDKNKDDKVENKKEKSAYRIKVLKRIEQLEQEGKATVIAPSHPIKISRFEKEIKKLKELYELGYQDAATQINKIKKLKD